MLVAARQPRIRRE
jgi:hypothetical protein